MRDSWAAAVRAGRILTCWPVRFELLFSTGNARDFAQLEHRLTAFRDIPITVSVQRAALTGLRELSERGAGHHRVPLADVLVAAAAQEGGVGVLHYDKHFDRLNEVLAFENRWIAPAGSL